MIKAAQWTSAIVGMMVAEVMAVMYMPDMALEFLSQPTVALTIAVVFRPIVAIASVKIDEWRMA